MKIKTNKTNKTNKSKKNNTRKTNNKGRTYRRGGQVKPRVRGAPVNLSQPPRAAYPARQGKQNYNPRKPYVGLIPDAQLHGMVNWLKQSTELSICAEVSKLIPAFQNTPDVPVKLPEPVAIMGNGAKQYIIGTESYFIKTAEEATPIINKLQAESAAIRIERSRITCATLLLLGMISYRLQKSRNKFIIVAKGGLGVAIMSSNLVSVGDLDFKVVKNPFFRGEYDPAEGLHLSLYICNLIGSVLQQIVGQGYSISVLDPTTRGRVSGYQNIVKVSLRGPNGELYPFLDMDFGDYEKNKHYFENMRMIPKSIPIGGPVSLIFQNAGLMFTEKLYYYAQYLFLKDLLADTEYINNLKSARNKADISPFGTITYESTINEGMPADVIKFNGEPITGAECARFLEKFKRSINLITDAIIAVNTVDKSALSLNALRRDVVDDFMLHIPELPLQSGVPKLVQLRLQILNSLYPEV